jgi:hypothetical protein
MGESSDSVVPIISWNLVLDGFGTPCSQMLYIKEGKIKLRLKFKLVWEILPTSHITRTESIHLFSVIALTVNRCVNNHSVDHVMPYHSLQCKESFTVGNTARETFFTYQLFTMSFPAPCLPSTQNSTSFPSFTSWIHQLRHASSVGGEWKFFQLWCDLHSKFSLVPPQYHPV